MYSSGPFNRQPQNLEEWAELLRIEELPIFSNTAQNIYHALDDKKKGAMDLASVILQDPNLTAKLLRFANSPYYNPSRQKINTISRAIVILGLELIRELTLACSFFESILSSADKERANKEIAWAIHAAVQARELAILTRDLCPEEVFIAALLHNIGHIAFWCSSNKYAVQFHGAISRSKLEAKEAEKKTLGFCLIDLSKKLSKSWHLGGLIDAAISHPDSEDKRIRTVRIGSQICNAIAQGWDSKAMADCMEQMEDLSGKPREALEPRIKANINKAVDIARQFGALDASTHISPDQKLPAVAVHEEEGPNRKQIQFQVLQDISSHISSGAINLNVLLEMVLEGIHRGVAMDRTLFMLLGSDKMSLNEKISLGWQRDYAAEKFHIHNNDFNGNLLFHDLQHHDGLWYKPEEHAALYTQQIENYFGRHECFVFPIKVERKSVGLIYCDRGIGNETLSPEDFSAAKHFVRQAEIGLTLYRMKTNN
ncbi:MAG: HDOD domain-containing protein [Methylomonas sp.]|nr:HDOD domain-containing protein [Methylomonas sp.]